MIAHHKRKMEKDNKMITIASFLVFILLTSLIIMIDMFTYQYSFIEAWRIMFQVELLTGRIILYFTFAISFISAIIIDLRILKKKRKKQTI